MCVGPGYRVQVWDRAWNTSAAWPARLRCQAEECSCCRGAVGCSPFPSQLHPKLWGTGVGVQQGPVGWGGCSGFPGEEAGAASEVSMQPQLGSSSRGGERGGDGHVLQAAFCSLCQAFSLELARVLPALAPSKCYTLCGAAKVPRREAGGSTKGIAEAGLRFPGLFASPGYVDVPEDLLITWQISGLLLHFPDKLYSLINPR